ncbi:bifunctional nuclease family protein, partial [Nitrospinae bacterium AH_259_B05_G02_I21]|nr:bifunctional nuclease family protein [Nitrospinae bacterium AH_259_B05_G02_I21]
MLEMTIKGLALDPSSKVPIVILEDLAKERAFPIWIGHSEAQAIALKMEDVPVPRPMTHDLIKNILEGIQATVSRIV